MKSFIANYFLDSNEYHIRARTKEAALDLLREIYPDNSREDFDIYELDLSLTESLEELP